MKRPVLVTIIGVLATLGGLAQTVFGVVLFGLRNDSTFLADANIESNRVMSLAVGSVVVGAVTIVLAIGLLRGSRVSRALLGIVEVAGIAFSIWALVALDSSHRAAAIGSIAASVIVLYFLFGTAKAKAFFAR